MIEGLGTRFSDCFSFLEFLFSQKKEEFLYPWQIEELERIRKSSPHDRTSKLKFFPAKE